MTCREQDKVAAIQSLGSIRLTAQVNATLGLTTSATDVVFTAAVGFDFQGQQYQAGPFALDVHIGTLAAVLSAIEQWLVNNVTTVCILIEDKQLNLIIFSSHDQCFTG